jgi:hypothetical protein
MVTVTKVHENEQLDLFELTTKTANAMVGSERTLNPYVMNFMVKLLLSSPQLTLEPVLVLTIFNLLLSQTVLFCADVDSRIAVRLLKTCGLVLRLVSKNISLFAETKSTIEAFVNNKILHLICLDLDYSRSDNNADQLTDKKRELLHL